MKLFRKKKPTEPPEPEPIEEVPEEPTPPIQPERIAYRKLWKAGLAAAIVAAVANVFVYYLGVGLGIPVVAPAEPGSAELVSMPISWVMITSAVMAVCATLLLALIGLPFLNRLFPQPTRLFRAIAIFFLVFSFGGPLSLPVEWPTMAVLSLMHIMAFIVIVGILTISSREKKVGV